MGNLHVILDIDNTLVDSMNKNDYKKIKDLVREPDVYFPEAQMYIWKRPNLDEFLNYLNNNVRFISIWTNGTQGWMDFILKKIISPIIHKAKLEYLLSIDFSTPIQIIRENMTSKIYVKELKKLFRLNHSEISFHNTILIDDNYYNCWFNKNNSIPIKKFYIMNENKKKNKDLLFIMEILETLKKSNDLTDTLSKVYSGINNYNELFDN